MVRGLLLLLLAACSAPAAPAPAADKTFDLICARCHGPEGRGGPADATGVGPRNFHDATFQSSRSDDELKRVIREGKNGHMPAFGGAFPPATLDALVARIRSYNPKEAAR